MTVVADSGAIYALVDRDDSWHQRVRSWWEQSRDSVVLPITILPEVAYLLGRRIGPRAEAAFVRSLADGDLTVENLEPADLGRAADLMATYRDAPFGFVDASIAAIAERLGSLTVLTTDRLHFSVVRPRHTPSFILEP